ncbi:MAG TPA: hypothetical protein VOA78_08310 [Candidatus Dormibacteraeota bacterium]|nr:hypothetical protein [Candidatus Dormibacteraeota bacterium]
MNDSGGNLADGTTEVSDNAVSPSTELRKRRSTRIVQAVPLSVTGVDALGRPFTERTSTLIINCHGCRYQSKHYVLKNMWVSLEVPHSETGQPPRTVRGRVAWIQRPRTVRQLFQVALELEIPGNAWSIAFPPEDWFSFPDPSSHVMGAAANGPEAPASSETAASELEFSLPLADAELPPAMGADNLRVMPAPGSTTDASLQLARQVARLLADAKQQIQAAAREAATHAVSAESRASFDQWEQKFAAARAEVANEASRAIERIRREADERSRDANAAAAEVLRDELPRWLAPQLEQLTRDLTAHLSQEGATQRSEHALQLASAAGSLQSICGQAEETAARLKAQAAEMEARAAAEREAGARAQEESTRQREETAAAEREALQVAARQAQEQLGSAVETVKANWQSHLASELDAAHARLQAVLEAGFGAAREQAAASLTEHSRDLMSRVQEDSANHFTMLRENAASNSAEVEQRLAALKEALQGQTQRLDGVLARAQEAILQLEHFSSRVETVQLQAIGGFQSQLDDVLILHRNELHRRSESLFEEINARIRSTFEDASHQAVAHFDEQIQAKVEPHISRADEAMHRLAGGRSLLDAALTLQQDRIRASADEAFAESLGRFRENLGSVEQLLQETAQSVNSRNLQELEARINELKHQAVEDIFKSSEWYEKRAQTQIQAGAEKALEQTAQNFREKAGEVSAVFASELDHSSRSFVAHTRTQIDDVVREGFDRARALFAEAADTTSAAFTDEIQRNARTELDGFVEEVHKSAAETRIELDTTRAAIALRVSGEQEDFLRRFQGALGRVLESSVLEAQQRVQQGFAPVLDSWKSLITGHQVELGQLFSRLAEDAAEQHRHRLEGVSTQWMLATVANLDHQSREIIASISSTAEEKLRATFTEVFSEMAGTLSDRLHQIASNMETPSSDLKSKAQTASGQS